MYCPNCGKQNENKNKFCLACGERFPLLPAQAATPAQREPIQPTGRPVYAATELKNLPRPGANRPIIISLIVLIILAGVTWAGFQWVSNNTGMESSLSFPWDATKVNEIATLDLPEGAIMRIGRGTTNAVEISPDQKTIAVASSLGIWLYEADSLNFIALIKSDDGITNVTWSPNGMYLLADTNRRKTILWEVESKRQVLEVVGSSPAWSPDGHYFKRETDDNHVIIWDVVNQQEKLNLAGRQAAWSPDGRALAGNTGGGQTVVWNVDSGAQMFTLEGNFPSWSPDGSRLVSVTGDGQVMVWDVLSNQQLLKFEGYSATWSPDGKWLVVNTSTGNYSPVAIHDAASGVETLRTREVWYEGIQWSPDGRRLIIGHIGDNTEVWDAERQEIILTIERNENFGWKPAWSPNGNSIVVSKDKVFEIWDLETGKIRQSFAWDKASIIQFIWSKNNRQLLSLSGDGDIALWELQNEKQIGLVEASGQGQCPHPRKG